MSNKERCKVCGEVKEWAGSLNSEGQCAECSEICDFCEKSKTVVGDLHEVSTGSKACRECIPF